MIKITLPARSIFFLSPKFVIDYNVDCFPPSMILFGTSIDPSAMGADVFGNPRR